MGLSRNLPTLLDYYSGWTKEQADEINTIAVNMKNEFIERARQKVQSAPMVDKFSKSNWSRVLNLRDFMYNDTFNLSFILDPNGFVNGGTYRLFEIPSIPSYVKFEGSNSDDKPAVFLTSLGTISYDNYRDGYVMSFVKNDTVDWPVDSDGNKVKYSVYISGRT